MRRRTYLALAGSGLAALAGCTDGAGSGDPTDDPGAGTSSDGGTTTLGTTSEPGTTIGGDSAIARVGLDHLLPGMVQPVSPDSIGVTEDGSQYLYLSVTKREGADPPARGDFSFAFAGDTHGPSEYEDDAWEFWRTRESGEGNRYSAAVGSGWLLFRLPATADDPGDCTLEWPSGSWTAPEALRERLAGPHPEMAVDVDVPSTVSELEKPTIEVTVENQGDVTGGFVAALNRSGPMVAYMPLTTARFAVPAGETKTWTYTDEQVDLYAGDETRAKPARYHVHWHDGGTARRSVEAVENTSESA
jgi:hypothetical protein